VLTQFAGEQFTVDETGRNLVISKIIGGFPWTCGEGCAVACARRVCLIKESSIA
jgi:hypothetical protein